MILVTLVLAGAIAPMAQPTVPTSSTLCVHGPPKVSETTLVVTNTTFNYHQEFNDDDFRFVVRNGSEPVSGALVTLYNATGDVAYQHTTQSDGSWAFYNVRPGVYTWNVTWDEAPEAFVTGTLVSDGPEAFADVELGNLDWGNDDDDLNATVVDIVGAAASGLNFSIHFRDNNTIWDQQIIDDEGHVSFVDVPEGNYTWKVTVLSRVENPYNGTVIASGNFTSDGTEVLVRTWLSSFLAGSPEYYDFEVYTYYEQSLSPLEGAVVNATYANGTVIGTETTPANGSVTIVDLPVAPVNISITYQGRYLGAGNYTFNLTALAYDERLPVVHGPGNKVFLYGSSNMHLTWELYDEYPEKFEVYIDGSLESTVDWVNQSYTYTLDFPRTGLGNYTVTLTAYDQNQNMATVTSWVWIHETTAPVVEGPGPVEFYYTETGYMLQWNVSDDHLNMFTLTRNGTVVRSGTVDPDNPSIMTSLDGLPIGLHIYRLTVNDTSGNTAYDEVRVTVKRDDVAPVFVYEPGTVYYNYGDVNIVRNWTVRDDFMLSYEILVDGVLVESGSWDSETIEFDFAGLAEGVHYVNLTVTDLGGNNASSSVMVVVGAPLYVTAGLYIGSLVGAVVVIAALVWYARYR